MIRCTLEMIPKGDESKAYTLGSVEIGNDGTGNAVSGDYTVILRKTPPWKGALIDTWKVATLLASAEDDEIIIGNVKGFNRNLRGPYDLLYKALKACGLDRRNR